MFTFFSKGGHNELPSPRTTDSYVIPDKFRTTSPQTPSEAKTPPVTNTEETSVMEYLTSTLNFLVDFSTYPSTSENESTEGLDFDTSTSVGHTSDFTEYLSTIEWETVSETDSLITTESLNAMQSTLDTTTYIDSTTETVLTTEGLDRHFPSTIGGM